MDSIGNGRKRLTIRMAVMAALAVTVVSTSAFAIPVGVGSILDARKAAVAAKAAGSRVGTKTCPKAQQQKAAAGKKAADKSGLTSLSRWFL